MMRVTAGGAEAGAAAGAAAAGASATRPAIAAAPAAGAFGGGGGAGSFAVRPGFTGVAGAAGAGAGAGDPLLHAARTMNSIASCFMRPTKSTARAGVALRAIARLPRARVAAGDISVLLLGETGVGKEVCAELVHARSPRAAAPMVKLNCGAFTETLLESELFGHDKGAFSGAIAAKVGLLESADGGT